MLNKIILSIFINKKVKNEREIIKILFLRFIFGKARFKTNKREYAEPAMQGPMISIGICLINKVWPCKETLNKRLKRK